MQQSVSPRACSVGGTDDRAPAAAPPAQPSQDTFGDHRKRRPARGHAARGPPVLPPPDEASLFGLPVEPAADPFVEDEADAVLEPVEDDLVVVLRPDLPAGSLLLVAGTAGALSLFLPWVQHDEALGMTLVQQGVDLAGSGVGALADRGLLLPIGVSTGGAVLLALGLLAFRPAHTHRVTGVVALLVSLAVATGLVVRVADEEWDAVLADPGAFCAVLAAAFGLLGALKAMLTAPAVITGPW